MNGSGIVPAGDVDPHLYRCAGITNLSVAVLDRAMRDAQLVEVGHQVRVCRLEKRSDRERRHLVMARRWLTDATDEVFRMWASGAGLEAEHIASSIQRRVAWTEHLEEKADISEPIPSHHYRSPSQSWPFRRVGDDRELENANK